MERLPKQEHNTGPAFGGDVLSLEELIVEQLDGSAHAHKLKQSVVTIGRDSDNDIVLPDASVSRHHARLEWAQGVWRLVELGSTNGTLINGRRLSPHIPTDWPANAGVQMGGFTLRLRTANGDTPPPEQTKFLLPEQVPLAARVQRSGYAARRESRPFSVNMWPTRAVDNSRIHIAVQNEANVAQDFHVSASAAEQLSVSHSDWHLEVAPGVESRILFTLRVQRRPLYGTPRHYPYQIVVSAEDGARRTAEGTAEARPLLSSTGLLVLAILLMSALVTAIILTAVR